MSTHDRPSDPSLVQRFIERAQGLEGPTELRRIDQPSGTGAGIVVRAPATRLRPSLADGQLVRYGDVIGRRREADLGRLVIEDLGVSGRRFAVPLAEIQTVEAFDVKCCDMRHVLRGRYEIDWTDSDRIGAARPFLPSGHGLFRVGDAVDYRVFSYWCTKIGRLLLTYVEHVHDDVLFCAHALVLRRILKDLRTYQDSLFRQRDEIVRAMDEAPKIVNAARRDVGLLEDAPARIAPEHVWAMENVEGSQCEHGIPACSHCKESAPGIDSLIFAEAPVPQTWQRGPRVAPQANVADILIESVPRHPEVRAHPCALVALHVVYKELTDKPKDRSYVLHGWQLVVAFENALTLLPRGILPQTTGPESKP